MVALKASRRGIDDAGPLPGRLPENQLFVPASKPSLLDKFNAATRFQLV